MKDITINNHLLCNFPTIDRDEIHNKNKKNAIVMYSGGLDSTVALYWALDNYKSVEVLIVDYNQQHSIEIDYAISFAKMLCVDYKVIKISIPKEFWGIENRLTRGQACLMTSIAALDISQEGADIVHGILRTDNYGDCDRLFLDSFANVLFHPDDIGEIGIATPLRALNRKEDVIAMAYIYGIPINKTWTCRNPYNNIPCGTCAQCIQKKTAIESFFDMYKVNRNSFNSWQHIAASPYHPIVNNTVSYSSIMEILLNTNAFRFAKPCLKYWAPDNTERIATKFSRIPKRNFKKTTQIVNALSAHGYFEDNYRWEVCFCDDGTIAITSRVPDEKIIEKIIIDTILG